LAHVDGGGNRNSALWKYRPISVVFGGMRSQGWSAGSRMLARNLPIGWRRPGDIGDNNGNDKIISSTIEAELLGNVPAWWRAFVRWFVLHQSSSIRAQIAALKLDRMRMRVRVADDGHAYLGLVAEAVGAIDPDVLSQNLAFLVKLHVLGQLAVTLATTSVRRGKGLSYVGGI
jgi:hypothetical protein